MQRGTGTPGLLWRRARAGSGLLLTILLLVATTTAIIAGTVGYSGAAATTAARQALTDAQSPTEAGLRVQTRLAPEPDTQDRAARGHIARAFAPATVQVIATLASEPRPVSGQEGRLQVLASADLQAPTPGEVDLVQGTWPVGPGDPGTVRGALHAGTAARWEVGVGDLLDVGGVEVEVVALWRPADAGDPVWFGDPLPASGAAEVGGADLGGPLVVGTDAITAFGDTPFVRWTVLPVAQDLQPGDLAVLAGAARRLELALDDPAVDVRGVLIEGDLAPTSAAAAQNLATARALSTVPLALLLLVSVVAVLQVARLLAAARTDQIEVLIARGASRAQVLGWSAVEAVIVTTVGTLVGTLGAALLLRLVPAGAAQSTGVVMVGVLTGLAVLAGLMVLTVLQVRAVAGGRSADRSGRTTTVAAAGTVLLVAAGAGLSWWQLRRTGSPLVTRADGALATDLLAGLAPTLLLATVGVLALALIGPVSRVVELVTRRGVGVLPHLPAAQVSRGLTVYAVPVLLTVLAVGAVTLAASYAATSQDLRTRLAQLGQGADVRALLEAGPVAGESGEVATLPALDTVPGVQAVSPVWRLDAAVAATDVRLTIAPLSTWQDVAVVPEGGTDPATLTPLLTPSPGAEDAEPLLVPAGVERLEVPLDLRVAYGADTLEALDQVLPVEVESGLSQGLDAAEAEQRAVGALLEQGRLDGDAVVRVLLRDPATGVVQSVRAGTAPVDLAVQPAAQGADGEERDGEGSDGFTSTPSTTRTTAVVTLPGAGRSEVVGVDVQLPPAGLQVEVSATLAVLAGPDGERLPDRGVAARWSLPGSEVGLRSTSVAADPAGGWRLEAIAPAGTGAGQGAGPALRLRAEGPQDPPVPLAVSTGFARNNGLSVGSPVDLSLYGARVRTEVVTVVDSVPGTLDPGSALADSGAVSAALLRQGRWLPPASELWLAVQDPGTAVGQVAAVQGVTSAAGPGPVSGTDPAASVRLVFWVAAVGALLLAVTGVGAVAATLAGSRRPEVAVLRALGMTPGQQARARSGEVAGVVLAAVLLGLAAGWAVSAAVVPDLATSTTARDQARLATSLTLQTGPWLLLMALTALAVLAVLLALAVRVRAQALDATYREEVR